MKKTFIAVITVLMMILISIDVNASALCGGLSVSGSQAGNNVRWVISDEHGIESAIVNNGLYAGQNVGFSGSTSQTVTMAVVKNGTYSITVTCKEGESKTCSVTVTNMEVTTEATTEATTEKHTEATTETTTEKRTESTTEATTERHAEATTEDAGRRAEATTQDISKEIEKTDKPAEGATETSTEKHETIENTSEEYDTESNEDSIEEGNTEKPKSQIKTISGKNQDVEEKGNNAILYLCIAVLAGLIIVVIMVIIILRVMERKNFMREMEKEDIQVIEYENPEKYDEGEKRTKIKGNAFRKKD